MQFDGILISSSDEPVILIKDKNIEYKLSSPERLILLCLLENENELMTYEYLMQVGWGVSSSSAKASLSVSVCNLRRYLKYSNFRIVTVRKEGYLLSHVGMQYGLIRRLIKRIISRFSQLIYK
ncbi:helix-turn-helix domain-containing protein [Vibrio chagasii]|uniref:helix-turn-helix domain-containing protein n=1 Tax=Vibrio chagasii TaxID=170679 RepID=UPI0038CD643B